MHDPANGLRRFYLLRGSVNKSVKKGRSSKQLQTEMLVSLTESLDDP
jgi:hypothetical protein